MKKIRLIAWVLSLIMLLSMVPAFSMLASADDAAENTASLPCTFPDGSKMTSAVFLDYTTVGEPCEGWVNSTTYEEGVGYTMTGSNMLSHNIDSGDFSKAKGVLVEFDSTASKCDIRFAMILRTPNNNEGHIGAQFFSNENLKYSGYAGGTENSNHFVYANGAWLDELTTQANNWGNMAVLPKGTTGYIYIPFEAFGLNQQPGDTGAVKRDLLMNVMEKLDPSVRYVVNFGASIGAVSGGSNPNLVLKNVSFVYGEDVFSLNGASVELENSFNVNFYGTLDESIQDAKLTVTRNGQIVEVEGVSVRDNADQYKFSYKNILPQSMTDVLDVTLSATVGKMKLTQSITYSIQEYCMNMLTKEDTSSELKTLLVDILNYGAAAQEYSEYRTNDLANAKLTPEQKALAGKDSTSEITAVATGTDSANYKWSSAKLRLETSVALQLSFAAENVSSDLTVEVTLGGRTVTFSFAEGAENSIVSLGGNVYAVIFSNIGANEYDREITAVIKTGGVQVGHVLQYSIAAYVKDTVDQNKVDQLALVKALYTYGKSAAAYVAANA